MKKRRSRIEIEVNLENSRAVPIASVHRAAPSVGITHCDRILDTLLKVAATTPAGLAARRKRSLFYKTSAAFPPLFSAATANLSYCKSFSGARGPGGPRGTLEVP